MTLEWYFEALGISDFCHVGLICSEGCIAQPRYLGMRGAKPLLGLCMLAARVRDSCRELLWKLFYGKKDQGL